MKNLPIFKVSCSRVQGYLLSAALMAVSWGFTLKLVGDSGTMFRVLATKVDVETLVLLGVASSVILLGLLTALAYKGLTWLESFDEALA